MGRKNKPINDGFNTLSMTNISSFQEKNNIDPLNKIISQNITNEVEKYQNLYDQNLALIKERDDLIGKLEIYIQELNKYKNLNEKQKDNIEISAIEELNNKINNLSSLNNEYILKISQLTFENAVLKNQLTEFNKSSTNTINQTINTNLKEDELKINKPKKQFSFYNNGYSSWN